MKVTDYRSVIKLSHQRCREMGIKKDQVFSSKIITNSELQNKFAENRNMIVTASPYIEQLFNFVKGNNFFVLLTDGEGCILNAIGDEKILSEAFDLKMVPGAYMNEENIGTNAMGIVVKTGNHVQLSGDEHYIKAYHRWTCSAAPIKDINGNLIGVLDLTGYTDLVHPHTLGMVIAASNAIEEMMKVKQYNEFKNMTNRHIKRIFNSVPVSIVTSDIEGNIKLFNDKALELLEYKKSQLKKLTMKDIIEQWDDLKGDIYASGNVSNQVHIKANKNKFLSNLTTNPIYSSQDDDVEIVHIFTKIKKTSPKRNEYRAYYTFDKIIGQDKEFFKVIQYAKKISNSKSTILILGESGTGKELFAQSIHNFSERKDEPFVALNCAAIPKQLLESELFGYEEGAYTGAKKGGNIGKFELANGGTIMLDEIGEMPLDMQTKLLRVLQEGVITKIGCRKPISVDVRIIAATNKDLRQEVKKGRFRKDLFYRLNVLPLYIPPLRERKGDIPLLIEYFMKNLAEKLGKEEIKISKEYLNIMLNYNWPGNVRELENVIELIINTGSMPVEYFKNVELNDNIQNIIYGEALDLESVEREHIKRVLKIFNNNITHSAKALNIRRNTLYNKIKKYDIRL